MLDRLAIEFEATAFKAAFCSLFFEVPSQPCQHWTHYIPLSPPLRISFWAWADRRANNTHAWPDVRDLRTSGNCCYQSPPFRRPRDQRNGGSGDENGQRQVTTCCTCAVMSRKKCHVSGCRRWAGDVCCLRCLIHSGNLSPKFFIQVYYSRLTARWQLWIKSFVYNSA